MRAEDVVALVRGLRFCYADEGDLQDGLDQALTEAEIAFDREESLSPRDRIDFLIDRTGVEVKFKGSWREVERQLRRYLESDRLDEVLLVTTKTVHLRIEQGTLTAGDPPRPKRLLVYQLSGL